MDQTVIDARLFGDQPFAVNLCEPCAKSFYSALSRHRMEDANRAAREGVGPLPAIILCMSGIVGLVIGFLIGVAVG